MIQAALDGLARDVGVSGLEYDAASASWAVGFIAVATASGGQISGGQTPRDPPSEVVCVARSVGAGQPGRVELADCVQPEGEDECCRLQVFYAGTWGTVCDDSFGDVDATVACRQAGFSSGVAYDTFGEDWFPGEGFIWMDEVDCQGGEESLADCDFDGWGCVLSPPASH